MSETLSFLNTPDSPFVGDINKWNIWTRLLVKVGEDQKHGVATAGNQPASRSNGPKRTGGSTCMTEGTVRNITYLKVTFLAGAAPKTTRDNFATRLYGSARPIGIVFRSCNDPDTRVSLLGERGYIASGNCAFVSLMSAYVSLLGRDGSYAKKRIPGGIRTPPSRMVKPGDARTYISPSNYEKAYPAATTRNATSPGWN